MTRAELITMARHNMALTKAGTIDQEPEVLHVPGRHYYDPERWQRERERVFKRMPLMRTYRVCLRNRKYWAFQHN